MLFETFLNGQTPGKYVLGLRVLTDNGQPINGMQATLRNLLRAADLFLPLVGLIVMALNRKYSGWATWSPARSSSSKSGSG